jgi:multicomponent Na+:H+ antiporter subunit D
MVNIHTLPLYLILIPLTFAFLSLLFNKLARLLGVLAPIINLFIISKLSYVLFHTKDSIIVTLGGWKPPFSINLVASPVSLFLAMLVSLIGLASAIYSLRYIHGKLYYKYYSLFLLLIVGATGSVLTGDIFNLFVFFEIILYQFFSPNVQELNQYNHPQSISE